MARILTIDDNSNNLDLMTYLLEASGHVVILAATGEIGVALATTERPDLIVLDIELPGRTGYEVLAQLRCAPGVVNVPIVAVTAHAMANDRDRALRAGFDGYLSKPIDPTSFARALDRYLPAQLQGHAPKPRWQESFETQRGALLTMRTTDGTGR